jgi:acyl-CoA thioester hydrolase
MNPALLATYPVVIELPVVWGEMDAYRHVNNVVYFRYFESVRVEYCRHLNWFEYERETGIGPILASIQARFRRPLTYPDRISVGARVIAIDKDRFTVDHIVVSHQQNAVTTEGHGVVVSYNHIEGKKVLLPEEIRRRITELEASVAPKND